MEASDNHPTVPQLAVTTVYVTVIRDVTPPRFTNLPQSIDVDENSAVGRCVDIVVMDFFFNKLFLVNLKVISGQHNSAQLCPN